MNPCFKPDNMYKRLGSTIINEGNDYLDQESYEDGSTWIVDKIGYDRFQSHLVVYIMIYLNSIINIS